LTVLFGKIELENNPKAIIRTTQSIKLFCFCLCVSKNQALFAFMAIKAGLERKSKMCLVVRWQRKPVWLMSGGKNKRT